MIEVFLFILGAISGSFVVASVWRLRADQLAKDKDDNEDYQKLVKNNKLSSVKPSQDYSRCLNCGHKLAWYDLIPILSWLSLGGKCRYCKHKIGHLELIAELSLAVLFLGSYFWLESFNFYQLAIWLGLIVILAVLFIYDHKWMAMPSKVLYLFILWSVLFALSRTITAFNSKMLIDYLGAIFIMAGIYGLLWLGSKGRWVGSGDIYLGFGLGLILGDWKLAIISLFLANFIGTLWVLPQLLFKKTTHQSKIALGPLLIIGFLITFFIQATIKGNLYYFY